MRVRDLTIFSFSFVKYHYYSGAILPPITTKAHLLDVGNSHSQVLVLRDFRVFFFLLFILSAVRLLLNGLGMR